MGLQLMEIRRVAGVKNAAVHPSIGIFLEQPYNYDDSFYFSHFISGLIWVSKLSV